MLERPKRLYWWFADPETSPFESFMDLFRSREVDLAHVLIADPRWECGLQASTVPDGGSRLSTPLHSSPHVAFLQQYRTMGEDIFLWRHFEKTPYFRHATLVVAHAGHYFQSSLPDDIRQQAKYFAAVYDSIRNDDPEEVEAVPGSLHSRRAALPMVHETLTPGTTAILDGHHRLAIAWVLGHTRKQATVRPPRPTELQRLVLASAQARGQDPDQHELLQPVRAPEFDGAWRVVDGQCGMRLKRMLEFLDARLGTAGHASVLDVGCQYGWFLKTFARRKWETLGVDSDAAGLQIGRTAYGLERSQLVQADLFDFLWRCDRRFDVVLCMDPRRAYRSEEDCDGRVRLVKLLDRITASVLFLAATPERGGDEAHGWDRTSLTHLLREHTRFAQVVPLGPEAPGDAPGPGATLLACLRV